ncbi:reverse transcriptase domain-containing protein [Artemisia annua]|uniref:Reverse transcriptase domain-containing protein n=1 Tax=Artemisia annua TaxID=35608 RepID=A0A2U1M981_ARTAN|nr:reverse transcriptase domain-containing protein [Artemisia annua]
MATKLGNPIMLDYHMSSMCLQSWGLMDYACTLIDIRVDRELKDEMIIVIPNVEEDGEVLHTMRVKHASRGTNMGSKVQFKPKKKFYQTVSKKNGSSSIGTKNNSEKPSHVTNLANPFDTLNMIENDDELGSNVVSSNSDANPYSMLLPFTCHKQILIPRTRI